MQNTLQTSYFLQALQDKLEVSQGLTSTFATVEAISENGYYVDVKTVFILEGMQVIKNIPVVRNKYINFEIEQGDVVILLTLDHLQGEYQETKKLDQAIYNKSYLAIPYCFLQEFKEANSSKSNKGLTLAIPDSSYLINITKDNGIIITDKNEQNSITLNDSSVVITNKQNTITLDDNGVSISSSMPIEVKTQGGSLYNLLNDFFTFLSSAQTGNCPTGAPTTVIGSTSLPQLQQIVAQLAQLLK